MANRNLGKARKKQDDEFYTQLHDIENEMKYHKKSFKDKVVFCCCDDPRQSKFWEYFMMYFDDLGLKKLVSTHYGPSRLFYSDRTPAYMLEWDGKNETKTDIIGNDFFEDGDFRSNDCKEILKEADIVCTNPPFSLSDEFIGQLMDYEKEFLVLGNFISVSMKNIFGYIQRNEMWLGYTPRGHTFLRPDGSTKEVNSAWFTNLPNNKRNEELELHETFSEKKFPEYDNYEAIEIGRVVNIPEKYDGVMGVPITFLEKYNPDQFEILDANDIRKHARVPFKPHGLIKDKDSTIKGKAKFPRFVIRHRRGIQNAAG